MPQAIFTPRKIGRLDKGYDANVRVLRGDPLENLERLGDVRLRIKQGRVLP
jgi:imidazolonepropionase-like amidohydrolase